MTRYVNLALRRLSLSTHPKHRLVAVIVRGGAVVAFAANSGRWGRHAEVRALGAFGSARRDLDGAIMIVVRDGLALAKPCLACQGVIKEAGISKVWFSAAGTLHAMNVNG